MGEDTRGVQALAWKAAMPMQEGGGSCGHRQVEFRLAIGIVQESQEEYWYCGIVEMWDYEIMGLWNWVETFSISEFRYGAFSQLHNLTINLACRVRL